MKTAANAAIKEVFEEYQRMYSSRSAEVIEQQPLRKKCRWEDVFEEQRNELEQCLEEPRIRYDSDILAFWKANASLYPTLCKMAQDYLAIQPTSKDIEGTFSKARRVIPYYRRQQTDDSIRNQMLVNSGYKLGISSYKQ